MSAWLVCTTFGVPVLFIVALAVVRAVRSELEERRRAKTNDAFLDWLGGGTVAR